MLKRIGSSSGFTLIELVVVGAIAAVLVTATVGQYRDFISNQRLHAWSETIASDLRAGQQVGVSQRRTVVAVFDGNSYTIMADNTVIKADQFPPDITSTPETVTFSALGTTSTAGTITLRSLLTNRTRVISVAASTGRVRID